MGVYCDDENDFYQLELSFAGSDKFTDVTETRDEMIITTSDRRIIVYRSVDIENPSF